MPSLSIGAKLTLRYSTAVAVTLTAAALFVYSQVEQRINREAGLLIETQAREIADEFGTKLASESFEAALAWMDGRLELAVRSSDPELRMTGQLVSQDGTSLLAAGPLAEAAPPVSQAVLDGRLPELLRAVNVGESRPFLSMSVRVPQGAVQLLIDTQRYSSNVGHIRDVLLWSLPLVILVTAGVGWLLARWSLLPLQRITAAARRIDTESLDETVPATGSGDELDHLADTLNDMLQRIRESVAGMQRFNANAAHQLRTPLNAISNQVEVTLEKRREPDEYRRVLEDVLGRTHELARGVEAMLRLAQAEAGLLPGTREPVDLSAVVSTVCEFFAPLAQDSGVALTLGAVPAGPVSGDEAWLHELFSNLVVNAIQYAPRGARVAVAGWTDDGEVTVEVNDEGPGIPADRLPLIFDRFERAETAGGTTGFGLGLAIAMQIARAHGGHIEAQSAPGKGTRMRVHLPIATRAA